VHSGDDTPFKSDLNEIVILIVGMAYISEILIFFTHDMQTEFSFTVEREVYCMLPMNSPMGQNAYCFVLIIPIGHCASRNDLVSACVYP
jgi:hypothetical protein